MLPLVTLADDAEDLARAAKSPYDLARFVNTHVEFSWEPMARALGINDYSHLPCGQEGFGPNLELMHQPTCSAAVLRVANPPQAIAILYPTGIGPTLLRYRQKGSSWEFAGAYELMGKDLLPVYTVIRFGKRSYFIVRHREMPGSGLQSEIEEWIDLETAKFEPVFSLVISEIFSDITSGTDQETVASIASWETEPVEIIEVEYRDSTTRSNTILDSKTGTATFVRQGDTFVFDPSRSTVSEKYVGGLR